MSIVKTILIEETNRKKLIQLKVNKILFNKAKENIMGIDDLKQWFQHTWGFGDDYFDKWLSIRNKVFAELLNGLQKRTISQYPASVFYVKQGSVYFELKQTLLICNHELVWSIFNTTFSMDYYDTKAFIEKKARKHFNLLEINATESFDNSFKKAVKLLKLR